MVWRWRQAAWFLVAMAAGLGEPAWAQDTLAGIGSKINGLQPQGSSGGCRGLPSLLGVVATDMPRGVHDLPDSHPLRVSWEDAKARAKPLQEQRQQQLAEMDRLDYKYGLDNPFYFAFGGTRDLRMSETDLSAFTAAEAAATRLARLLEPIEMEAVRYMDAARKQCGG